MHIAFVAPFPSSPEAIPGGVAGVAKYLADALTERGDTKVTIIHPRMITSQARLSDWGKYQVIETGRAKLGAILPGRIYSTLFSKRQIRDILKKLCPDVVHFHGFCDLSLGSDYPSVVTIHGIAERDVLYEGSFVTRWLRWAPEALIEGRARSKIQNLIMISEYGKRALQGAIHPKREWLIPNPIAPEFFDVSRSPEPFRLFSCSRIVPLKNIDGLIRAMHYVIRSIPQAKLRIAGNGPGEYMTYCRALVDELGLEKQVKFVGHLSLEQVRVELGRAAALIVSSFQENSPLSIAEAMAAGVPVVATPVGGVPEMIEIGRTGVLAADVSSEGIGRAIVELLQSNTDEFSKVAREAAKRRHFPGTVANLHLAIYSELAAEK